MDDRKPGRNPLFVVATMAMVSLAACSRTPFPQGGDAARGDQAVDAAVLARDVRVPVPDASPAFLDVHAPGLDSMATTSETPPSFVSLLGGRSFELRSNLPAPTLDPTCASRSTTTWYTLDFSTDILTVTISELSARATTPMHGTIGPESDKITYHINDAFAGGTVTLEWDQGLVVAQLTLYGSGVPVVACVRAPLTPQP